MSEPRPGNARRRIVITVVVLGSLAATVLGALIVRYVCTGPIHYRKTSVLMLTLCTVRADHLGCYGYERDLSPNIDRLAAEGFRFERVLAQAPWTRAGVAAIITGMYPRSLNIEDPDSQKGEDQPHDGENYRRLHDDFTTMAEVMRDHGYFTIGITANPNTNAVFGFDQGYDHYEDPGRLWQTGYGRKHVWSSEDVNWGFLNQLDELEKGTRFFAHLIYIDAHTPGKNKVELDGDDRFTIPPRGERAPVDTYDLQISFLDENIGLLREELATRGYSDDLLIVINGDHGEAFKERHPIDRRHSRRVYNSTIWVPWIVHHPALKRAGHTYDGLVEQIDMLPTLMELLGISRESADKGKSTLAGVSRYPVFADPSSVEAVDWSVVRTQFLGADKAAVVTPEHKLILNFDWKKKVGWRRLGKDGPYYFPPEYELYSYGSDPLEQDNLYEREPERAAELLGYFEAWQRDFPPLVKAEEIRVDQKTVKQSMEQLRDLGYVGSDDEEDDEEEVPNDNANGTV